MHYLIYMPTKFYILHISYISRDSADTIIQAHNAFYITHLNQILIHKLFTIHMKEQFRVHWHTGMLLLAQHFQQSDKYHQYMLKNLINSLSPYTFGILQLNLDTAVENQIIVKCVHAIMPDFTMIYCEPNTADENLYINLDKILEQTADGTYYIFLCTPDKERAREFGYNPVVQNIADNVNTELIEPVTVLKPKLQLIFAKEAPFQMQAIPLLELSVLNNQYTITQYEAPFIQWQDDSILYRRLESLILQLRNKISYWQKNPEHSSKIDQIKLAFMSHLSILEEQWLSKSHPYEIFKTLLHIVGSISFLNINIMPRFSYNHNNIVHSFNACLDYIAYIISGMRDQYERMQFQISNDAFRLKLSHDITLYSDQKFKGKFLIIGARKFQKSSTLKDWISTCVISTTSMLEKTKRSRILGARREIIDTVDSLHIQSSSDYIFFLIYIDDATINLEDEELLIYNENSQAFPDLIEIYTDTHSVHV